MTTSTYPRFDGTQECSTATAEQRDSLDGRTGPEAGRRLCQGCRFQPDCLAYALDHDVVGIWGARTDEERHELRKHAGLPQPTPMSEHLDDLVRTWRVTASSVAGARGGVR